MLQNQLHLAYRIIGKEFTWEVNVAGRITLLSCQQHQLFNLVSCNICLSNCVMLANRNDKLLRCLHMVTKADPMAFVHGCR